MAEVSLLTRIFLLFFSIQFLCPPITTSQPFIYLIFSYPQIPYSDLSFNLSSWERSPFFQTTKATLASPCCKIRFHRSGGSSLTFRSRSQRFDGSCSRSGTHLDLPFLVDVVIPPSKAYPFRRPSLAFVLDKLTRFGTSYMDWFLVLILIVLLWVVSLCKVLYASFSPRTNVAFLSNGEIVSKRKVMLVVAHPDDEAMFFSPTILYLISEGHNIHILCLSTGNADGIGNIRKEELYHACTALKVPHQQIKILDHPDLQDGFNNMWSSTLIAKIIEEETVSQDIDLLITFDSYGISGHRNHRDVHNGICTFLCGESQRSKEAWELVSTSILRKYSGPVDVWLSILSASNSRGQAHCLLNKHPRTSLMAMAQHKSQWIWFRKLFVVFSSYTYVNVLRKIKV